MPHRPPLLPLVTLLLATLTACTPTVLVGAEGWGATPVEMAPLPAGSELEFRGGLVIDSTLPRFGGLSSMRIDADGRQVDAISDKGRRFRIGLTYDANGRLAGISKVATDGPLIDADGKPVSYADAEGQTRFRGGLLVSLERSHSLWYYPPKGMRPEPLDRPAAMAELPENKGVEAITRLADGRLLLLAEGGGDGIDLPGWVGLPGDWHALAYRTEGFFLPTDAALLPDGDVLVVERSYFLGNIAWRLRRIEAASIAPGATLRPHELARFAPPQPADNMEGLAVRTTPSGEVLVYVLSDNNLSEQQDTLLLMFALKPPPSQTAAAPAPPPAAPAPVAGR